MRRYPQILFFIAGTMPTAKDEADALMLGPNVSFRNASLIVPAATLEKCDGVAGCVPECYAKAFPSAEEAIATFQKEINEAAKVATKTAKAEAKGNAAKGSDWKANA